MNSKFSENNFEILAAVTLAVIAAILSVTDLFAGKYGDDEIIATNEKANMYQWYQSKGLKQGVAESQHDLAKLLIESSAIPAERKESIERWMNSLNQEIDRYKKEKTEILNGTEAIGGKSLVNEGGEVIGGKQWEARLAILGPAGDIFDMAVLYFQISLVLGAISIVVKNTRIKWSMYGITIILATIGFYYSISAFNFVEKLT